MTKIAIVALVLMASLLVGCSGGDVVEQGACEPAGSAADPVLGIEGRATATDGAEVWALFFADAGSTAGEAVRIPVGEEVKIVWRATGQGDLVIVAEGPDGQLIDPDWGPDPHGGSNWRRPGNEWGTGWTLPSVGCWTFRVERQELAATLSVDVVEPS